MAKTFKCGWCITGDCGGCRSQIKYEDRVYACACTHKPTPLSQREWLGYHVDVDGRPE